MKIFKFYIGTFLIALNHIIYNTLNLYIISGAAIFVPATANIFEHSEKVKYLKILYPCQKWHDRLQQKQQKFLTNNSFDCEHHHTPQEGRDTSYLKKQIGND